ncbi:MAG: alanine racemase [Candidatus Coatesbacteria bacterium RBG_13_66_14]|uniref:Alanine racemase n=1 Tax=Candidatus Coatesbacteria bacterium RBG_13_66_14 TaxID=1817816 RepID=A0A1F5FES9_9BACT|nr:MAG: alanine racemase [Candidatus Coatesbacteria bacterium RBG_13_66_14]
MYPNRPIWAEVDLSAIRDNLLAVKERVGRGVKVMAVVKSDAYGHGKLEVARALDPYADWFGVSFVDEGVELRQAGFDQPILCMVTPLPDELDAVIKYRLTPVLSDASLAGQLGERLARMEWMSAYRRDFDVHVKVDTGMGRLGVWHAEAPETVARIEAVPGVHVAGLMTHFPLADGEDKDFAREQLGLFARVRRELGKKGLKPELCHAANSAAIADLPESFLDMVRPGLALYGSYSSPHVTRNLDVRTAIALRARIAAVKTLPAGTTVSYGRLHRLERETPVGVLPLGYADGWRRSLGGRAEALVRGKRRPIIGAICMDMCMVDLGGLGEVTPGEVVTLLGRDYSGEKIEVEEVARWMDTVPYEVTCGLSERVPRHYLRTE